MDRISQLPLGIVDHMLSFLITPDGPPKELVRMSVLSKTWFHLTASFRDLYFVNDDFIPRESFFKYAEYTTSRFCHQNLPARTFMFITTVEDPSECDIINKCIRLILNNGVEKLAIDITNNSPESESPKYQLPNLPLSISMLKWLSICNCELPLFEDVKFKSLSFLKLGNIRISEELIECFATSCPLLETFHIYKCNGFDKFCVHGHRSLRSVRIDYDTRVERIDIEAPNLSELFVLNTDGRGVVPRMSVASCEKLTKMTYIVHPPPISNDFTTFLSNFPFVENFTLITGSDRLKLSSRTLKTLMLNSCYDLEKVELCVPNLDVVLYTCHPCFRDIVRVLTHLKASVQCYLHDYVDELWFLGLRVFLGKKNGFKALNLYIRTDQEFTELEELKAMELPPYELEHVELQLDNHEKPLDFASFVDIVLWCCRPRSLTLISRIRLTDFEEQSGVVMFTYEKLLKQEDQSHTNIKIVPSRKGKEIRFVKEAVFQEDSDNQRFAGLKVL